MNVLREGGLMSGRLAFIVESEVGIVVTVFDKDHRPYWVRFGEVPEIVRKTEEYFLKGGLTKRRMQPSVIARELGSENVEVIQALMSILWKFQNAQMYSGTHSKYGSCIQFK